MIQEKETPQGFGLEEATQRISNFLQISYPNVVREGLEGLQSGKELSFDSKDGKTVKVRRDGEMYNFNMETP